MRLLLLSFLVFLSFINLSVTTSESSLSPHLNPDSSNILHESSIRSKRQAGGADAALTGLKLPHAPDAATNANQLKGGAAVSDESRRRRRRSLLEKLSRKTSQLFSGRRNPLISVSYGPSSYDGPTNQWTPVENYEPSYVPTNSHYYPQTDSHHNNFVSGGFNGSISNPSLNVYTTQTQRRFNRINNDLPLAVKFQESFRDNPALRDQIVINPDGVTCADLCKDEEVHVTHGAIGFCTRRFCKCQLQLVLSRRSYREEQCPVGQVFDTVQLVCDIPQNTIMCSDRPFLNNRLAAQNGLSPGGLLGGQTNYLVGQAPVQAVAPPVQYYYLVQEPQPVQVQPQQVLISQPVPVVASQPEQPVLVGQPILLQNQAPVYQQQYVLSHSVPVSNVATTGSLVQQVVGK